MDIQHKVQQCHQLITIGKPLIAIERLRKIANSAQSAKQPQAMISVAEFIVLAGDWKLALKIFDKALSMLHEDKGEHALRIGFVLTTHQRHSEAKEILEIAQKYLAEDDVRVLILLADNYERLGKFDAAKETIEIILRYHPNSIPAHRMAASIARQEGRMDDALQWLHKMQGDNVPIHWEAARAWYEKGQIHDKVGEYDKAMHAWQVAKQYYPQEAQYNLLQKQAHFAIHHADRMFDSLTKEQLQSWQNRRKQLPKEQALTILTGHPRSGTTLLEQALDSHPQAISAEETSIFSSTIHGPIIEGKPADIPQSQLLETLSKTELSQFRRQYQSLANLALGEQVKGRMLIDKNPDLLQLLPTVIRVFPEARILMALRDPRDILISIFSQPLPANHNAICHLSLEDSSQFVAKRLGLWIKLRNLDADIAHVIKYENLVQNFETEVAQTLDYMGLPWDPKCINTSENTTRRVVQSPTYAAVREPVHTKAMRRWENYLPWIEPHLKHLDPIVESLGYS